MTQTIEAVIDDSGQVRFSQPPSIKGIHRALATILDEPPAQNIEPGELFGIWRDYSETASVDRYLGNLRKGRF